MISFILNHLPVHCSDSPAAVLLDIIRDRQRLTGTKEACREGECGACTVLVGSLQPDHAVVYRSVACCLLPIGSVHGCHVVTVEGLCGDGNLTLVQQLMIEHSASQCGFCTPGMLMSLTAFCLTSISFSFDDAIDALDGNLCRCTGYRSIRAAAKALCEALEGVDRSRENRVRVLVDCGVIPRFFLHVSEQLKAVQNTAEIVSETAWATEYRPDASVPLGSNWIFIAGGTDLLVQRPQQLQRARLLFLSQRRDLHYMHIRDDQLHVGAAVSIETFRTSSLVREHFPRLVHDLLLHSSTILRNNATLAGNLVNASPIGDITIIFLALGARIVLEAADHSTRTMPLESFYLGYKKLDLAPGEMLCEMIIPLLRDGESFHFEKVSNRVILDTAAVNTALRARVTADGKLGAVRISAGGVGPIPLVFSNFNEFYGKFPTGEVAQSIAAVVSEAVNPIDDIRGTANYKRLLLNNLVLAHFMDLQKHDTSFPKTLQSDSLQ